MQRGERGAAASPDRPELGKGVCGGPKAWRLCSVEGEGGVPADRRCPRCALTSQFRRVTQGAHAPPARRIILVAPYGAINAADDLGLLARHRRQGPHSRCFQCVTPRAWAQTLELGARRCWLLSVSVRGSPGLSVADH